MEKASSLYDARAMRLFMYNIYIHKFYKIYKALCTVTHSNVFHLTNLITVKCLVFRSDKRFEAEKKHRINHIIF